MKPSAPERFLPRGQEDGEARIGDGGREKSPEAILARRGESFDEPAGNTGTLWAIQGHYTDLGNAELKSSRMLERAIARISTAERDKLLRYSDRPRIPRITIVSPEFGSILGIRTFELATVSSVSQFVYAPITAEMVWLTTGSYWIPILSFGPSM